jgi:hypothetical protein
MTPPPMGGTPMQGGTGRSLGPAGGPLPPTGRTLGRDLSRLGDLPGAKPPPYMIDQLGDIFGFGDRRKERYIADTQGGYPNRGIRSLPEYMDPMPMPWDYESPMPSPMPLPRDFETGPMEPMAAVDPSDWRTLETILGAGGNPDDYVQMAEMGGYGYNPDPNKTYDDLYGGQDIIDMEILPGAGYGPSDEHEFDRKKGFENRIWGIEPQYSARGGIASLRR